jgi:hypothetical protein
MIAAVISAAILTLQAQISDQIRQATITGSRGTSGKCTIEVRVDMTAEVEIYGDSGRLRTLAGQPATWTRMECTDPLPYNMSDFRFRGIDGRGNVRLLQDPRGNNSVAVVRIEDPKPGSEGYTFDIEWSGASGGAPGGGFQGNARSQRGAWGPGGTGGLGNRRGGNRNITSERAIDLCRNEVRARAESYNLRNIDITSAGVDNSGRGDRVTGEFRERDNRSRSGGYRFNCSLDAKTGQVRNVEILRADGSAVQSGSYAPNAVYSQGAYDQNRVLRACQDAVVARTARDGYQNVSFGSTSVDSSRNGRVSGNMTATRGPVTDNFEFGCSMDLNSATVRNVEVIRR